MVGSLAETIKSSRPNIFSLPGGWEPEEFLLPELSTKLTAKKHPIDGFDGCIIDKALLPSDCSKLIQLMEKSPRFEEVSVQGRKDIVDNRIGSLRTTIWSPALSFRIWQNFKHLIPDRIMDDHSATDWWQEDKNRIHWTPVGMSPMLRFMRYDAGGQHSAHYDAGYIYQDDSIRTLQSVVIYLTDATNSGSTRFVKDGQSNLPIWDRDHQDWTREVSPSEVIYNSYPKQGKFLVFDHRICHDVDTYHEPGPRIIIRADIVFKGSR